MAARPNPQGQLALQNQLNLFPRRFLDILVNGIACKATTTSVLSGCLEGRNGRRSCESTRADADKVYKL